MSKFPGSGLARGLAVTGRTLTKQSVTREYPDVKPDLPPRSRGVIGLLEENCTSCMLCARECPDWCIYIDSHKETLPAATEGGRARTRNVLDRFAIDYALCMYCGICIEVCPFDALFWSPEFEYAEHDILGLTHEREELRDWMWTVPAPPATDRGAEPPKELLTATAGPSPVTRARRESADDSAAVPADVPAEPTDRPAATPPSEVEGSGPAPDGADDAG